MIKKLFTIAALIALWTGLPLTLSAADKGITVKVVRFFTYASFTRIVFELDGAAPYVLTKTGAAGKTLMLAAYEGAVSLATPLPAINDGVAKNLELKQDAGRAHILIHMDAAAGEVKDFVLRSPDRIVLDISRGAAAEQPAPPAVKTDQRTIIVLDPGHGGGDTGIVTARGQEKTLTLALAQAIRKILKRNRELSVILTREKDASPSLEERAASANGARARLLVSLHSAPGSGARVYILDADDDVGTTRPPADPGDFLGFEAAAEQREILWGAQQARHVRESGKLAKLLGRHLGAPGAGDPMPLRLALLAAVDAAAVILETGVEGDQARTAEAIAKGIEQYVRENR